MVRVGVMVPVEATVPVGATVRAGVMVPPDATVPVGVAVRAGVMVPADATVPVGATVRAGVMVPVDAIVPVGAMVRAGVIVPVDATVPVGATHGYSWNVWLGVFGRLGVKAEAHKWNTFKMYGNLASACAPIALALGIEAGEIERGHRIMAVTPSAGMQISTMTFVY